VSLYSLRKVYDGPIALFFPRRDRKLNPESISFCFAIADYFNCTPIEIDVGVEFGKNLVFLERTHYHKITPFETSISIDSDTIVVSPRIVDYFDAAEKNEFSIAKFGTWGTRGGVIRKRLSVWEDLYPELMEDAIEFGSAINCGCFCFRRDAKIMQDWFDHAVKRRDTFIADETCMQLLLPQYPHKLMDACYNTSCKYDKKIHEDGYPVMIHYHGKKHCRLNDKGKPLFRSERWVEVYDRCRQEDIFRTVGMDENDSYGDKMVRRYILGVN
jgi:hypothetical protein